MIHSFEFAEIESLANCDAEQLFVGIRLCRMHAADFEFR